MARIKVSVLMAATAAVMIGLGVGWADDGPPPAPPPAAPPKAAARDRIPPAPVPPSLKPGSTDMPPVVNGQSANFSVAAPTAVMARAIANEAEYQRKALAVRWLGGKLPDWPRPCSIRVTGENRKGGATAFRFGPDGKPRAPGFVSAEMELHGPFEYVLTTSLPHEVMHTVLATHFGKPVPRWADEGIALLAEPAEEQTRYDGACRKLVQDGKAFRPRTLFRAKEYPRDMMALYAQGHSLVRFLGSRGPKLPMSRAFLEIDGTAYRPGDTRARTYALLIFIQLGQSGDWDKAAKEVYGFDSVDALEAAWLDWLKKPESKLGGQPTPPAAKPADPNRIPPTPLPAGEGKLPGDTIRVTSRTQTFPIKPGLDREKNAKEVHLYVSRDRGASWQKQAVALPGQTKFVFEAPADGLYWLTVVIVTTDGRTVPPDLGRLEPMQKILVDTGGEGKR